MTIHQRYQDSWSIPPHEFWPHPYFRLLHQNGRYPNVSGTVTTGTFVVRREDVDLISLDISDKLRMVVPDSNGTKEVAVPRFLRRQPSLNGDQVVEVANLSLDLEQRLGWPVDLECAYDEETLYLLQCRPITTLH